MKEMKVGPFVAISVAQVPMFNRRKGCDCFVRQIQGLFLRNLSCFRKGNYTSWSLDKILN
jgi:hypothetical protein